MIPHFEAIVTNSRPPTLPLLKEEVFSVYHEAKPAVFQLESFLICNVCQNRHSVYSGLGYVEPYAIEESLQIYPSSDSFKFLTNAMKDQIKRLL
jgi:hypothetical protein